jgi:poly [ADP-ribose] polymerase
MSEKVRLVFSDLSKRSYKYWDGELLDDGTVISTFGVVGATNPQSKNFGKVGKSFFDKKIREKLNKGYEHAKVIIEGANSTAIVQKGTLADIAMRQIKHSNDLVKKLIRRLADSNIHKITSSTSISFNNGVFKTPLGIVSQEGIDEARHLLQWFFKFQPKRKSVDQTYNEKIDKYLKIIPRPKGGGLHYEDIFDTSESIQKESDVIDALENSLSLATTPTVDPDDKTVEEKVFDLSIEVETDDKIRKRLEKWYEDTKKSMHNYSNVKVCDIYSVDLLNYNSNFREELGNIIQVWHGSSECNVLSILKCGLMTSPPSTASIAGKLFGNGIYGSETSSKALGYSLGRWGQRSGDSGWLFVCDFAMGNAHYPKTYGINGIPQGHNSCWALPKNTGLHNDELIVYDTSQVRIKYILEVK